MFSEASSADISAAYVAVRVIGGADDTDMGRTLRRRYGVSTYPTMFALTADGAILRRSFQRSVAGILSAMSAAAETQKQFLAVSAALAGKQDAASLRRLATLYGERSQFRQARALLERISSAERTVADQVALLAILAALDDTAATQALLQTLIATHADHPDNIRWRIELALAAAPQEFATREAKEAAGVQRVAALTALLIRTERVSDQAQVRLQIARLLNSSPGRAGALEHWDWILEQARDSAAAPEALMQKAIALYMGAAGAADKLEQVRLLLQEIVDKHPQHPAAEGAKRYLPRVQRTIDRARAAEDASSK